MWGTEMLKPWKSILSGALRGTHAARIEREGRKEEEEEEGSC